MDVVKRALTRSLPAYLSARAEKSRQRESMHR